MKEYQDLCLHPRHFHEVLSKDGAIEHVRCTGCGKEWSRHEDATGEDI